MQVDARQAPRHRGGNHESIVRAGLTLLDDQFRDLAAVYGGHIHEGRPGLEPPPQRRAHQRDHSQADPPLSELHVIPAS